LGKNKEEKPKEKTKEHTFFKGNIENLRLHVKPNPVLLLTGDQE
jgi:hypothetical protein